MAEPSPNHCNAGFTLVELLVSLTILALLLAMVPGTLRLGRRAWETPGQLDQASDELAALAFVQTHIKSAVPIFERDAQGVSRIAFSGGPQSISFIVPLSGGPFGGGLYKIELGGALRVSLYQGANAAGQSALPAEERTLGSLSGRLQLRYFGSPQYGQPPLWQGIWPRTDRLPDLVEIDASPLGKSRKAPPIFRGELKLRPVS